MAPSKKTKSVPNVTANLMKALIKNKTEMAEPVKKKGVQSSPESVKKTAISKNLKGKLSNKKKKKDESVPNRQEGLRLLKRGPVTMHRIVRRKMLGNKLPVLFNAKGEPYGEAATEMHSYIGVLARTKAPIWYDSWKRVPKEMKNKIWDCVQIAYVVPPTARSIVLKSANSKWREFKSRLTTVYIFPHKNQRELLEFPPADYSLIEKAHWDIFVADRLSDDFDGIHNTQQKRRKMNEYDHCMSRKGYSNLEHELSQGDPEMELDRSDMWVLARKDKDETFKSNKIKEVAEDIEKMKKRVSEGEVTVQGSDDVLTKVLGKPEHGGWVRGQGAYVKQSTYFNLPRQRKKGKSIEDRIQEGILKFMKEETERIIRERDSIWTEEVAKMKAALGMTIKPDCSPNIGSQQGSCSKGAHAMMKELELQGVRKKLDLIKDNIFVGEEKQIQEKTELEKKNEEKTEVEKMNEEKTEVEKKNEEKTEVEKKNEEKTEVEKKNEEKAEVEKKNEEKTEVEKNNEENIELEKIDEGEMEVVHVEDDQLAGKKVGVEPENIELEKINEGETEYELAIDSPTNIVAYATVDTKADVVHGKAIEEQNARVSITCAIQGSAKIPFPIKDEIVTVEQAIGTYISWPRDLIIEVKTSTAVKGSPMGGKKIMGKKFKNVKDCVPVPEEEEYVLDFGPDYPPPLKRLWVWAKNALKDGHVTSFQLCQQAFGSTSKKALFLSDVYALCSGDEISGSVICMFANLLQDYLKKNKMSDMVAFVDPATIGAIGCGTAGQRSQALSNRFKNSKPNQLFLLPYNHANHWALTAVNPDARIVYHMDPLKRRIASEEWTEVVDNAMILYKDKAKKFLKKRIMWENLAGVPLQIGSKDCGLFVMRYMKEICLDKELQFFEKWLRRSNKNCYGLPLLNEVRIDWANYFMKNHAS